ncbi:hypothetical protein [Nonomuraea basaltis]|uniref:hypothetical protein n=1 Tax=Nonomuraea basaltis TaxID=2495887 RepID=UPI00197CC047|nr:hypothetical protein [Nonomuraea basaltis]
MIVLLVNDHLLKQAWPGFATGKLSDVAGLVAAPALLALLFRRRADLAATVLTGVLFALVKTTETGAEAASQAWTLVAGPSRVLADPTDLLALPALALAWWVRRRSRTTAPSARWRIIVTIPLAVLAVTATAAAPPPPAADSVEVDRGGRITVRAEYGTTWFSEDGGTTWSEESTVSWPEEGDATSSAGSDVFPSEGSGEPVKVRQSAACVPYQAMRCYRVVPGQMAVEQSDDGSKTWALSWSLSGDDRERLLRRYDESSGLSAKGLAVQGWPGGHVVVVANGVDGIMVRDVSGTWRRVGWPGETEAAQVDLDPEFDVALFLAACMLFGGAGAGLRRHHRSYPVFAVVTCLGFYLALLGWGPELPFSSSGPMLLAGSLMTMTGALVCFVLLCTGHARPLPVAVGVLAAPLVYASAYLPFHGWAAGVPGSHWVAVVLAVLLTAAVLLGSVAIIRRDARRTDAGRTKAATWQA